MSEKSCVAVVFTRENENNYMKEFGGRNAQTENDNL